MYYIKVLWNHGATDEPVWLYSEINDDCWETRKVEVFADGSMGFADITEVKGGSMLSIEPFPKTAEIAEDPQFVPIEISKAEFEDVWIGRREKVRVNS